MIKNPALELGIGILLFLLLALGAIGFYSGLTWLVLPILLMVLTLGIFLAFKYDHQDYGLTLPPRRAWFILLVIIAINFLVGPLAGSLLPPGELPNPPGADLSEGLTSPLQVIVAIAHLLVVAAIPEELFYRVYLLPRLVPYTPVAWSIVIQALLFSAIHLPQQILSYGYPWAYALAGALSINNGLIGGYLWHRTRSLPLLIILHIFAYPRIGL